VLFLSLNFTKNFSVVGIFKILQTEVSDTYSNFH